MDPARTEDGLAAAFAWDGVVCVRATLGPDEVATAARAIETVLACPGPLAQVASRADDPGAFTEDFCRWVLSLRYLPADARHARPWRTSPPSPDLDRELPAGAALDHPLFPVAWPT